MLIIQVHLKNVLFVTKVIFKKGDLQFKHLSVMVVMMYNSIAILNILCVDRPFIIEYTKSKALYLLRKANLYEKSESLYFSLICPKD